MIASRRYFGFDSLILQGQRERSLAMHAETRLANPNNPTVLLLFAFCNVLAGDRKWAGKRLEAYEISPAGLVNYELLLGINLSHILSGEFDVCVEGALRSITANGSGWHTWAREAQLAASSPNELPLTMTIVEWADLPTRHRASPED